MAVCAADRAAGNGFVLLDVGRDSKGRKVPSLERVQRKVQKHLLADKKRLSVVKKLYIKGDWNTAKPTKKQDEASQDRLEDVYILQKTLADAQEWKDGVRAVRKLIRAMGKLKELVWISGLPFSASVFIDLPTKLTKLVLDLGNHVHVVDNSVHLTILHIAPDDMKPLLRMTRLQELRLLRLQDSMQSIAWKTVYSNQLPGGMRILELQMDSEPILRNNNNKWHKAVDVHGLTVALPKLLETPYKGRDGKGSLHWSFGYGEYLDGDCIRKARIASGVEEPLPLPLRSLKLDGFVIDHLPFENELRDLTLLTCGEKCIDAGMRAPKTQAEPYHPWCKTVNNAACGFLLQWPSWTGIFDIEGDQRDTHGNVVAQEVGLSTPYTEYPPSSSLPVPLTEEALNMKGISDALNDVPKPAYFSFAPTVSSLSVPDTPLGGASNLSERGSEVPTPARLSITTTDEVPVDGSITSGASSLASSEIIYDNGADDSMPEDSPTSTTCNNSFGSDDRAQGHRVRKSLSDSYWVLGPS
ncbi:hypothetical protein C7974DRAFT_458501 [Boeremia exigua]|uniref:uncharacterized protein n=1 Tax=Boeremia exigua TaxID=749465 RepID=UPI001E8DE299|nr:uncharacterized protein C7974DRAFT_458501 [Boeremia exigua]KAH6620383.1 hypothetical protein C7974DRAFT_458501 [Boeremia exigua]